MDDEQMERWMEDYGWMHGGWSMMDGWDDRWKMMDDDGGINGWMVKMNEGCLMEGWMDAGWRMMDGKMDG